MSLRYEPASEPLHISVADGQCGGGRLAIKGYITCLPLSYNLIFV